MRLQNIVVAIDIDESLLQPLYQWGRTFDFSHVSKVTFVHIVKKNITPLEFGLMESPDEKTFLEMRPTLEQFMNDEARKIIPQEYQGGVAHRLAMDLNPEDRMIEIVKELGATLVVVTTKERHGLEGFFHSSFTSHMIKLAPCDVFVVKPESIMFQEYPSGFESQAF
ncbi:MAG TPA: universal stress protein [Bacteriovoracaceae bacterium]|nr:universal stress protein [Bacteriovoracaceae bacterium]